MCSLELFSPISIHSKGLSFDNCSVTNKDPELFCVDAVQLYSVVTVSIYYLTGIQTQMSARSTKVLVKKDHNTDKRLTLTA